MPSPILSGFVQWLQSDLSTMTRNSFIHYVCLSGRRGRVCTPKDVAEPTLRRVPSRRQISTTQSSRHADILNREVPNLDQSLADATPNSSNSSAYTDEGKTVLPLEVTLHQARLYSPIDELRDRLLGGFRAYQRFEHLRSPELKYRKNSSDNLGGLSSDKPSRDPTARFPQWENVEEYKSRVFHQLRQKDIRSLIKGQLEKCRTPRDILQIVAVAMQRRETAAQMAHLHFPIMSTLYRVRSRTTDPEILTALNLIINRFRKENLPIRREFIVLGLRFAARSRSLPAMKRYLKEAQEQGVFISGRIFRSIVAKFSIGLGGLGEIRNGRWKKSHLLQVLLGFEGMDPAQPYHLGAFLRRDDWTCFHAWVAALARCKATDQLWKEWEWWRDSEKRKNSYPLRHSSVPLTVRTRGDAWFIEQLLYAKEHERAWQVMHETNMSFGLLSRNCRVWLMDHPEKVKKWGPREKRALVEKYDTELDKIERALGVKWISQGGEWNEGFHVSYADVVNTEETLEALADPPPRVTHGYPED
ncbi:MAG: hypothetical protein Q9165_006719 [Trypethelium subeluteriae]